MNIPEFVSVLVSSSIAEETLENLNEAQKTIEDLRSEAEPLYVEALGIYRQLVAINPAVYTVNLTEILNSAGQFYLQSEALSKAQTYLQEAADLLQPYAAQSPTVFGEKQAVNLYWLGKTQSMQDETEVACQHWQTALNLAQSEDLKQKITEAAESCQIP